MPNTYIQCPNWEPMTPADFPVVDHIGEILHPTLPETDEEFQARYRLFPQGCMVLKLGERVVGYAICHPWKLYDLPKLGVTIQKLPEHPDCMYLHDIAILPVARGQYASDFFLVKMLRFCRQLKLDSLALISVYGTHKHWESFGFKITPTDSPSMTMYSADAKYMIRRGLPL